MTLLQSLFLGVVQGITEFLPISSTAHLILAGKLMHLQETDFLKTFDVVIQAGSAFAVLTLWGYKLSTKKHLFGSVLLAFVPTAILGLALHSVVKTYLYESTPMIGGALLLGGIVMLLIDRTKPQVAMYDLVNVSPKQAVGIGLFQSLALIPGVSRSAASICGGMLLGLERAQATEFSFLLAVPTLLAASALDMAKQLPQLSSGDLLPLGLGFIAAYVSSMAVMLWLLNYVMKRRFTPFAVYRIIIGFLILFSPL